MALGCYSFFIERFYFFFTPKKKIIQKHQKKIVHTPITPPVAFASTYATAMISNSNMVQLYSTLQTQTSSMNFSFNQIKSNQRNKHTTTLA